MRGNEFEWTRRDRLSSNDVVVRELQKIIFGLLLGFQVCNLLSESIGFDKYSVGCWRLRVDELLAF